MSARPYPLAAVELDVSIQCRASIDTATVNEYAERMTEGDEFPPVVLFGTKAKAWIGDGWHRLLAAKQIGAADLAAVLRSGGRADALKFALGANSVHGHRRTNADKRRCVEIALAEFGRLSTASIAKLCGVSRPFVESLRQASATVADAPTRTTSDGRQYPARVARREPTARECAADLGCLARQEPPEPRSVAEFKRSIGAPPVQGRRAVASDAAAEVNRLAAQVQQAIETLDVKALDVETLAPVWALGTAISSLATYMNKEDPCRS